MRHRALGLALVAAACMPPAVPPVPSQGGPAWTGLTSAHFDVVTDGTPDEGRALVATMEHLRQVVFGVSYFNDVSPRRIFVVALRNVEEVHAYGPEQFVAHAWGRYNPLRQPVIALPIDHLDEERRSIVTHELTHAISSTALPIQPHWFAEGLATYFETVRLDEAAATLDVGAPQPGRVRTLRVERPLPIAQLFACSVPACMDGRYYATAWALFAFLFNKHPDELMHYMQQIATLPADEQTAAWPVAFPSLPVERIDHDLAEWLAYGTTRVNQYTIKLQQWPVDQRPLGDGDAYAARGLLRFLFDPQGPLPAELGSALAADPTNVLAHTLATFHDRTIAPDVARRVAAAHPDDWRAWWLVGIAVQTGPEAKQAHDTVCALRAKNPAAVPVEMCHSVP